MIHGFSRLLTNFSWDLQANVGRSNIGLFENRTLTYRLYQFRISSSWNVPLVFTFPNQKWEWLNSTLGGGSNAFVLFGSLFGVLVFFYPNPKLVSYILLFIFIWEEDLITKFSFRLGTFHIEKSQKLSLSDQNPD